MKDMKMQHYTDYEYQPSQASQNHSRSLPPVPTSDADPSRFLSNWGENGLVLSVAEFDTVTLGAVDRQQSTGLSVVAPAMSHVASAPAHSQHDSKYPKWWKNRRVQVTVVLSVVVLLGLVGFSLWQLTARGIPNVTLYRVSMKNVDLQVGGGGIAYPVQRLDISYPFSAHVLSVFVKPGDQVTPNQPLVQMDLSQVNAQNLEQLNAQVQQAYQDMLAAQAYLNSVQNSGNAVVIAQAQQQYAAAKNKYESLAGEASAPSLHQGKILSTISGTVIAVNVYPGQQWTANKVMLTIYDESSIIVRAKVPLADYEQVHINQQAQITPSAMPNLTFNGSVMSIIRNADPQTDTFQAWINVPNSARTLLPGMSVFAAIQSPVQALAVPRLAVLNPDRDSVVFVVNQGRTHIRPVQIIGYAGDSILIGSGIAANETIVLVGIDSLQDNQQVHVTGIEN